MATLVRLHAGSSRLDAFRAAHTQESVTRLPSGMMPWSAAKAMLDAAKFDVLAGRHSGREAFNLCGRQEPGYFRRYHQAHMKESTGLGKPWGRDNSLGRSGDLRRQGHGAGLMPQA
ncbi:hypothetical protein NUU61_005002 [Penicillium alfredii]|uniref:Uncharacterized protein n=1 Tax=Penicillium alfredii TaxID=1506179 RepID=A0A9W9F8N7_9EURO|nr:uncharacterized protein NUU61_005002 [Penicillium alfredii]KAJ5095646.1 hypothetical protein NUU61_005002 [Penicillium alfredii]